MESLRTEVRRGARILWKAPAFTTHKTNVANPQNLAGWFERNYSFESIAGFIDSNLNLTGESRPKRVIGSYVTLDFAGAISALRYE